MIWISVRRNERKERKEREERKERKETKEREERNERKEREKKKEGSQKIRAPFLSFSLSPFSLSPVFSRIFSLYLLAEYTFPSNSACESE